MEEFGVNIREMYETQVTVEAESKEDALREVERRWKDGETSSMLTIFRELTSGKMNRETSSENCGERGWMAELSSYRRRQSSS